ncbi:MAG: LytR/AlgR family response regulator transcription factor [Saprospiraceae bacterium]
MKIVIVDDELSAREILENLILRFHPNHSIVGIYEDLPQAVEGIKSTQPDLVFLDIEMPEYAGFEIVNFFEKIDFKIVFTTAYSQYALKAFELAAIDYLLKPIEIERLSQAITKVEKIVEVEQYREQLDQLSDLMKQPEKRISYLEKGFKEFISISDIVALEAQRAYTTIHTKTGNSIVISKNLKQFEDEFANANQFVRIHRSWIINLNEIIKFSKTKLEVHLYNNTIAKLSKKYITQLEQLILNN